MAAFTAEELCFKNRRYEESTIVIAAAFPAVCG